MRRSLLLAALVSAATAAAFGSAFPVRAGDTPEAPKPPDTPLPKYENPASDCVVGETCLFQLREPGDKTGSRLKYFEERVLARNADWALVETIETDVTGAKRYRVVPEHSRWWKIPKDFPADAGKGSEWKKDQQKDETLVVGTEALPKSVRCTLRVIEEPVTAGATDGPKRIRKIWYSHDVLGRGIAKMYPFYGMDAERTALSWDKKIPIEDCAKWAAKYPTAEEAAKPEPEPGMDEPGMGDPAGMDDPTMG